MKVEKVSQIYSKVAKMLSDQGLTVIVSVIAMYEKLLNSIEEI